MIRPRSIVILYNCPDCGHDWNDTWSCMVNADCPACGAKDIEPLDQDLSGAFEIVLDMARAKYNDATLSTQEQRDAIDAVTVYHMLNVKGN